MSVHRPWRSLHRGSLLADGLAFDIRIIAEAEAERRIFDLLEPPDRVFRCGSNLVLLLSEPKRFRAELAPGQVLLRRGSLLLGFIPTEDDEDALRTETEVFTWLEGGQRCSAPLDDEHREDASRWIDLSAFELITHVEPLGAIAPAPIEAAPPKTSDVREPLGVGPLDPKSAELIRALTQPKEPKEEPERRATSARVKDRPTGWLAIFRRSITGLTDLLRRGRGRPLDEDTRSPAVVAPPSARPAWLERAVSSLWALITRAAAVTGLLGAVTRKQARYLDQIMRMFDENDLDGALRHAIPLSDQVERALAGVRPHLGRLLPREDLSIHIHRAPASSTVYLQGDLFEALKQRYRRAFDRLVERGEIEKAAFVLAELMNASEEAVAFLERHGKLRLAAELAEARSLAPELVVRQWFIAGDRERAVAVARKTGTFAGAIARLERTHAEEAKALRLLWADSLASAGDYASAIEAIWPLEEGRALGRLWLDRAIEIGGQIGARMLARKVVLVPGAFDEVRARVRALLEDRSVESQLVCMAFGRALLREAATEETRILSQLCARALVVGSATSQDVDLRELLRELLRRSQDVALSLDVRALWSAQPSAADESVHVRAASGPTGAEGPTDSGELALVRSLDADRASGPSDRFDGTLGTAGLVLGVFDGAGGFELSLRSATLASTSITRALRRHGAAALRRSFEEAHRAFQRVFSEDDAEFSGPACSATIVTVIEGGTTLLVGQIGDGRAYLARGGRLVQITKDHTLLQAILDEELTKDQPFDASSAAASSAASVLTRVLAAQMTLGADVYRVLLRAGDRLLLCTDGVWRNLPEPRLRELLLRAVDPHTCALSLTRAASEHSRSRGVPTAVVADFSGPGLPEPYGAEVTVDAVTQDDADAPMQSSSRPEGLLRVQRRPSERGAISAHDVARLPDGRLLIAEGELGVIVTSRDGTIVTRFSEPADQIVLSDHGDRAILVSHRGEAHRLSRLDLVGKRVRPWLDTRLDGFATTYDGSTWLVSKDGTLFSIDALSDRWTHLFRMSDRTITNIVRIQRDEQAASLLVEMADGFEVWTYALPSMTLRRRHVVTDLIREVVHPVLSADGRLAGASSKEGSMTVFMGRAGRKTGRPASEARPRPEPTMLGLALTKRWLAYAELHEGAQLRVVDHREQETYVVLDLPGIESLQIRMDEEHLVAFDDRGRVFVLALDPPRLLQEHHLVAP